MFAPLTLTNITSILSLSNKRCIFIWQHFILFSCFFFFEFLAHQIAWHGSVSVTVCLKPLLVVFLHAFTLPCTLSAFGFIVDASIDSLSHATPHRRSCQIRQSDYTVSLSVCACVYESRIIFFAFLSCDCLLFFSLLFRSSFFGLCAFDSYLQCFFSCRRRHSAV